MRVSLLIMAALFSCAAAAQDGATVVPANVVPQPGQVVASGSVPDEATKADVLARLQQVYGVGNVIDQID
ncbi:cell envelope biogenesis protein OmpA, partial [Achromobacter sp. AGC25]